MSSASPLSASGGTTESINKTVFPILFTISFTHLLNDMMQSVIPAVYPLIKDHFTLTFTEIGLITLTFQLTASLLQPFVGFYTDRKPRPMSLVLGMAFTFTGLVLFSFAGTFALLLLAVGLVGVGSSVFHPESSRVAHMASGGRKGLAQSIFQVGGNAGSAIGPLLAALIVMPHGQRSLLVFSAVALAGVMILTMIGRWQARNFHRMKPKGTKSGAVTSFPKRTVVIALSVLVALTFSKYVYLASLTSYYTFYLI